MTVDTAVAIIGVAKNFGAYEGDVPGEDAQKLSDGKELTELAKTGFDGGARSEAILEILKVAGVDTDGEGAAPEPASGASDDPPSGATPSGDFDIDEVIPGYDDMKVKEIVEAMGKITDEATFNAVKAYEEENEERKKIRSLEFTPPAPPAAAAAPPSGSGDHSDYGDSAALEAAYSAGTVGQDTVSAKQLPEPGAGDLEIKVEIDTLSDSELARLQTRYHNADVRALMLLGVQEGLKDAAKRLGDDAYSAAYPRLLEEEKSNLDKQTASGVDGASSRAKHRADGDDSVKAWRNREARHGAEIRVIKAYQTAYEKGVARLSREQTRREKEKEVGGNRS